MKIQEAVIYYMPSRSGIDNGAAAVWVVSRDERAKYEQDYVFATGAATTSWMEMNLAELLVRLMAEFHKLVILNKIKPELVHQQFMKIDEYRQIINPDIACSEPTGAAVTRVHDWLGKFPGT